MKNLFCTPLYKFLLLKKNWMVSSNWIGMKHGFSSCLQTKDNRATESTTLPDQPSFIWDIHFDTSIEQLTVSHFVDMYMYL